MTIVMTPNDIHTNCSPNLVRFFSSFLTRFDSDSFLPLQLLQLVQLPWAAQKPVLILTALMPSPIAYLVVSAANVPWQRGRIDETGKSNSSKDGAIEPTTFFVIVVRWLKVYVIWPKNLMSLHATLYPMAKVATSRTFAEIPLPTVESVERCKMWKGCLTFLSQKAGRYI